jgi:uncharacterized membrane protein YfcA
MTFDLQFLNELSFYVPLILFFGALIYSVFGFGDALFSMPLLTMVIGIQTAVPLMTLSGATLATIMLFFNYKSANSKEVGKLLLGTLFGVPVGIFMLKNINEDIIKSIIGLMMIAYSLYQIRGRKQIIVLPKNSVYIFGFVAGMLAGAFNTSGPPIVMYGTLSGWSMQQFAATLQGYFLPTNLYVIVSQFFAGLLTKLVYSYYLFCLPFLLVAYSLGVIIRRKIPEENYKKYVYALILIIGMALLGGAILN